ncbi:MAG: LacI family DNA-binding transcriptional regulator [Mesorhizobium sp.]|uniref:LacI family DNA-binding transcriptional regulator n=1 Tax=Mesorhizobium sp. TaxID=1871066 RepID=UPI001223A68C|nr:LacI family DNA-binding transcriptional regulator [Mesorhizobium sp.]TIN03443.1 MAG: LacI family DNA-binding transcriptional regulator [Mesorhizobium sp.]
MKATVSDIARSCGLSTATVDRVLNNRPGASAANRQRVMEAAKQVGYLPVADQVTLPSRPAHLEFLLPIGSNAFMRDLAGHIEDYAARLPLVASCRIHNLAGILRDIVEAGMRLVTLVSDVPAAPRAAYVGIDNRVAGRTVALLMGRFLGGRTGHLAMVVGSRSYRGHEEREMGFRSVLSEEFPNLTVSSAVEVNDEPDASYTETMKALHDEPELLGIYCVGAGHSGVAKAIREARPNRKPVFICHDLTKDTRGRLVDDLLDVVIDQNARLIAEQSVIRLLGSIASSAPYLTRKFIEPRLIFRENVPVQ